MDDTTTSEGGGGVEVDMEDSQDLLFGGNGGANHLTTVEMEVRKRKIESNKR